MPVGGSTDTMAVDVVEQVMELTLNCSMFDLATFRQALATEYKVDVALIQVEDPPCGVPSDGGGRAARHRRLQQQTVAITITISSSGTAADGSSISMSANDLLTAVESVSNTALDGSLSAALGVPVSVVSSPPTTATVTKTISFDCPKGKWCTAGLIVDCPLDTYNNLTRQDYATACKVCPLNSHTEQEASTSEDDCLCDVNHYDKIVGPGVECALCPSGTDCNGGATLDRLPVRPSYYRLTNTTIDVRKCPDYEANCSTTFGTASCVSTSACRGGKSVKDQCNSLHTGIRADAIFCRACAPRPPGSSDLVYYVEAKDDEPAMCAPCGNRLASTMVVMLLTLLLLVVLLLIGHRIRRWHPTKMLWISESFSPLTKIKILFTFYMIVTKIDTIYEVSMPNEVRKTLEQLSRIVSLG